jgi:predicted GNAT family N-acyltransferase
LQKLFFMTVIPIEFGTPEYDETVALRYEILRKPIGLTFTEEQLSKEWADTHLACYNDASEVIGCLILTNLDDKTLKMRQVAVAVAYQGKGVGKKMVEASEAYAVANHFEQIELNARETAIPFYESLNYEIVSDFFQEVGINHKKMVKNFR